MSKIEIGSTIKIKHEIRDHVKELINSITSYEAMMITGAEGKKKATNALWELIHKKHPETVGFRVSLKHKELKVLITGVDNGNK